MGRDEFLARLASDFPEVLGEFSEYDEGLLHCEVAAFRRATEKAIDAGRLWEAERHFRFVEELLRQAGPELENALEVSYIEDLALGGCTPLRHQVVKERMPAALRTKMIGHHSQWQ